MFLEVLHDISAKTDLSKEMWVSISNGLKHLNTVLPVYCNFTPQLHNICLLYTVPVYCNCPLYLYIVTVHCICTLHTVFIYCTCPLYLYTVHCVPQLKVHYSATVHRQLERLVGERLVPLLAQVLLCTLYTVHCALYSLYCTLCSVHCVMYTVNYSVFTVQFSLYNVQCTQ